MSAEDAQLVSHREFSVQDVARILSVPLFMLGDGVCATYASARKSSRQFAVQALPLGHEAAARLPAVCALPEVQLWLLFNRGEAMCGREGCGPAAVRMNPRRSSRGVGFGNADRVA